MTQGIDIVIPWVDGNDKDWQKDFRKYSGDVEAKDDNSSIRYRDWDNLQYLFRGIEKFAPWVRKVHLVTNGQKPSWLNLDAPKLNFVTHKDFMPMEYLPTFSVRPIELNMHRIKDLAEKFVYFNDDFFITRPIKPERFFKKGLPCDMGVLDAIQPTVPRRLVLLNCVAAVNRHFNKRAALKNDFVKWYRMEYGINLFRTLALTPWSMFTGFRNTHLPQPFLKSVLAEVWNTETELLDNTSKHRFRDVTDVNQSLFRFWQLAAGKFHPKNVISGTNVTTYAAITDKNVHIIANMIEEQKYDLMVLNDSDDICCFEKDKNILNGALQKILPDKSTYEI